MNVFAGGDYLVFDGATQLVKTVPQEDHGLAAVEIRLTNTDARLRVDSGELAGLLAAQVMMLAVALYALGSRTAGDWQGPLSERSGC